MWAGLLQNHNREAPASVDFSKGTTCRDDAEASNGQGPPKFPVVLLTPLLAQASDMLCLRCVSDEQLSDYLNCTRIDFKVICRVNNMNFICCSLSHLRAGNSRVGVGRAWRGGLSSQFSAQSAKNSIWGFCLDNHETEVVFHFLVLVANLVT